MNHHPILFSTPMVKAILAGRKTQTRRVLKFPSIHQDWLQSINHQALKAVYTMPQGGYIFSSYHCSQAEINRLCANDPRGILCPYGQIGDRLWVRETWAVHPFLNKIKPSDLVTYTIEHIAYHADPDVNPSHYMWRPSIFMPRWASRLTLEITNIRVERLQDISETDAQAEGVVSWSGGSAGTTYKPEYQILWDSINKDRGFTWASNPWVWVIEFKPV